MNYKEHVTPENISGFFWAGVLLTFVVYFFDNIDDRDGWWFMDDVEQL